MRYLWDWYRDLSRGRPVGEHPSRLPHTEIQAWCWLNEVRLTPWELKAIKRLDDIEFRITVQQMNKARAAAQQR